MTVTNEEFINSETVKNEELSRNTDQLTVSVVESGYHQSDHQ